MNKPKIALIDGHSLVYRAFFALPPLRNAKGQPTQAVYGFLTMLLKLLQDERPDYVAVAFDRHGPVFRNELFEDYKGNRPSMPDDLRPQIPMLQELLDTLGIVRLDHEGYEADDVLGTLALKALDKDIEVLLVTGDRDGLQLVRPGLRLMVTRKGISELETFDVQAVRDRYGVEPAQLIDVKGLMGDSSDNIPGVPGVGEKTAVKLIQQFGSIDELYRRLDEVSGKKLLERLTEHEAQAKMSRELGKIVCDLEIDLDFEKLRFRPFDRERAVPHLEELGFRSLIQRMPFEAPAGDAEPSVGAAGAEREDGCSDRRSVPVRLVTGDWLQAARQWAGELKDRLASDTGDERDETQRNFLLAFEAEWHQSGREGRPLAFAVGCGLGDSNSLGPMIVFHFGALFNEESEQEETAKQAVPGYIPQDILQRWDECVAEIVGELIPLRMQGKALYFDVKPWLHLERRLEEKGLLCVASPGGNGADRNDSLPTKHREDLCIAAYLLDSSRSSYTLEDLAQLLTDRMLPDRQGLLGSGRKARSPFAVPADEWAAFLAERTETILSLAEAVQVELTQRGLERVYRELELPLTPVLVEMERNGILLDKKVLHDIGEELKSGIAQLTHEIYELAGESFNINSTQQLGQILFERLGLPVIKKTKTGYSTDVDVLEQLQAEHPIAEKIIRYRQRTKLYGTYVEGLQAQVDPDDGRIHTTFQQTVASTGRLSSKDPNLQNIPIREDEGRRLRRAFIAPKPGYLLLAADYSQIELRVLAHFAQDERMLEAFRHGEDIHTATAAEILGLDPDEVTPAQRSQAKAINFGIVYGISDFGLANNTGLTRQEAKSFIERYFEKYPGVQRYMKETIGRAREEGVVRTLYGRIRPLPELHSRVYARRQFAERTAMNTPIQGTAADIIKQAMVDVTSRLKREGLASRLLLQVHDELIFEVPEEELNTLAPLLKSTMEEAVTLDVPLVVDVKAGSNWYEMEKL